jgi:hypothetical protein
VCPDCQAWARAVIAAPAVPRDPNAPRILPPERVQRSPWVEAGGSPATRRADSYEAVAPPAEPRAFGALLDGVAAPSRPLPTLEEARARSIRWERTRCNAPEGWRCRAGDRRPCNRCVDVDFPFRAIVDGCSWKLRHNGPREPFALVVDGRELGAVEWPASWRSFGAPTQPKEPDGDGCEDEDDAD